MIALESQISSALRKTLQAIEKLGEADAQKVAELTGREYGRESSYLNDLTRLGILNKRRMGHQNLFSVKRIPLTILKLGGSVITFRDEDFSPNLEAIKRLSLEIANATRSDAGPSRLVILLGGGSFGHPVSRKWGLRQTPIEQSRNQVLGAAEFRTMIQALSSIVVDALLQNELPAYLVDPSGTIYQPDGTVSTDFLSILLSRGFLPVLSAGILLDVQGKLHLLIPEEMILSLSKLIKPSRVIFAVDVDGIYDKDPKRSLETQIIKKMTPKIMDTVEFGPTKYADIAGGMLSKVRIGFDLAGMDVEVEIVNGLKPGILQRVLSGEKGLGTTFESVKADA